MTFDPKNLKDFSGFGFIQLRVPDLWNPQQDGDMIELFEPGDESLTFSVHPIFITLKQEEPGDDEEKISRHLQELLDAKAGLIHILDDHAMVSGNKGLLRLVYDGEDRGQALRFYRYEFLQLFPAGLLIVNYSLVVFHSRLDGLDIPELVRILDKEILKTRIDEAALYRAFQIP